jgi:hypothetical protein
VKNKNILSASHLLPGFKHEAACSQILAPGNYMSHSITIKADYLEKDRLFTRFNPLSAFEYVRQSC